jgi:hypothetical protein
MFYDSLRSEAPPADAGNEALVRSLPELAREIGVPTSTILRLQREHPDRLPFIQIGAAQLFPEGVIPVLRALLEAEGLSGPSPQPGRSGQFSLTRQRREVKGASGPAPWLRAATLPPEKAPGKPKRQAFVPPSPSLPRSTAAASDREALAGRLQELERTQRRLADELAELIQKLRRPCVARLPGATA